MAKTSLKIKAARTQKFKVRTYHRCRLCGRTHAFMRKFGLCRHCFRKMAHEGQIPGVRKASW